MGAGFFLQFPFKFADLAYSDAWPKDLGTPGAWGGAFWNFECFELVDLFDFLIFLNYFHYVFLYFPYACLFVPLVSS